jgi:antitoxin MazE
MRLHVKKWGNSAAVRIPASVIAAASMHIDQAVEVREESGRIVIEPITAPIYILAALLDQMDSNTFPDEIDFGPAMGKEIW